MEATNESLYDVTGYDYCNTILSVDALVVLFFVGLRRSILPALWTISFELFLQGWVS